MGLALFTTAFAGARVPPAMRSCRPPLLQSDGISSVSFDMCADGIMHVTTLINQPLMHGAIWRNPRRIPACTSAEVLHQILQALRPNRPTCRSAPPPAPRP
ncbi:unnamed protein product [Prorocentrum cordatum]|uniref:Uncharacterized protein n=1 Tax=Prorocentrum cordatum TaxID=2364126 RepID=A0ABN9YC51_9DINO|nr:unnamed protein product [Polarella glacialis]